MKDGFDRALKLTLTFEGGNDDDPRDPGGRTSRGITQKEFTAWRRRQSLPAMDVWKASDDEVHAIYKVQYWDAVKGDDLPPGVDAVIFDGAVNSGPAQQIKWTQRSLGTVGVDGQIGQMTLDAIENYPDHDKLIAGTIARRLAFQQALQTWPTFGRGWKSRDDQLLRTGQAWAMGSVGPAIVYVPNMQKKANLADAKPLPSTALADATVSGGTVSTAIAQAQDKLTPFAHISTVEKLVAALTVGGIVVAAGGFAWGYYARRRHAALVDALDLQPASQAEPAMVAA